MAREAYREGTLPAELLARIERLAERIEDYLIEPRFPSLLHGDLWTGNVLVRGDRIAGFVDPAIYCGSPEIELAFTTMFGTFGAAFFEAYESLLPLEPGFHEIRARPLQSLSEPGSCAAVRVGLSAGDRPRFGAAWAISPGQKRTGPDGPGRSSLRNEPSAKGMALIAGWLAPPFLFLSRKSGSVRSLVMLCRPSGTRPPSAVPRWVTGPPAPSPTW